MTTDTAERARRLLHDAGELILADPMVLFQLARTVPGLLAEIADLDDQLHAALEPRPEVIAPVPDGIAGYTHPRGSMTLERVQ